MDFLQSESQSSMPLPSVQVPSHCSRIGILLCRDLIFTTKIQRTALDLGYQIMVIGEVSKVKRRSNQYTRGWS